MLHYLMAVWCVVCLSSTAVCMLIHLCSIRRLFHASYGFHAPKCSSCPLQSFIRLHNLGLFCCKRNVSGYRFKVVFFTSCTKLFQISRNVQFGLRMHNEVSDPGLDQIFHVVQTSGMLCWMWKKKFLAVQYRAGNIRSFDVMGIRALIRESGCTRYYYCSVPKSTDAKCLQQLELLRSTSMLGAAVGVTTFYLDVRLWSSLCLVDVLT